MIDVEKVERATAVQVLAAWSFLGGYLMAGLHLLPSSHLREFVGVCESLIAAIKREEAKR